MNYNKKGQPVFPSDKDQAIFAKQVEGTKQYVYYVMTYNNNIYDPLGPDSNREYNLNKELKKTNKEAFDHYISYLQSNNRIFMTKAQRSYLNG